MKRCFTLLILGFLCLNFTYAQNSKVLKDSINDFIRKAYYFKNSAKFESSVNTINKASKLIDSLDDDDSRIDRNNLLALLYMDFKEYNNIDIYLNSNKHLLTFNDYDYGKVTSNGITAILLAENKKYYEAINLLRETRLSLRNKKNENLTKLINYYEGIVNFKRNDLDKAKSIFESLDAIWHRYEQKQINARTNTYLSEIYFKEKEYDEALQYATKALNISNSGNLDRLKMEIHALLANVHEQLGDFEKAYYHANQSEKIEDEITDAVLLNNRSNFIANHEFDFQQRYIDVLQQDNELQQQQVNMSKLTSVLSSALLIIISLLTISLYRNNQIKFKTNDLLLKKNLELEFAKEEAEKAMQAKAQFLSTVSHELRTPLYAVTGLTHLLLEENPSESQKEHLKSLKFSGEYLLNFINDILQINKIEAKKLSIQKIPFNLKKALKDVVDTLHQTAKENDNNIELDIDPSLPKEFIGDPLKLSQIFINLIGNACKFTENGTIKVVAKKLSENNNTVDIHFEVADNGIGISKEMQATIFESFAQGSIQINRKYGGTGLGLTIVKSLLSLFNADIQLESEQGKGSTFMFDINFETPRQKKAPKSDITVEVEDSFFEDLHILVVEDNKINQVITKKMLIKKGMTCDIANDGYEAIEKAKSPIYNAILMDIHMPGISGLVTTREIRKFNNKVPIIALTAMSLDENTDDLFEAGCNDVITKPFKPQLFYGKIGDNILKNIEVNIS